MKKILFLTGIVTLLTTSGCLVSDGGRRDYGRHERGPEVRVAAPVVVVPAVRVRVD